MTSPLDHGIPIIRLTLEGMRATMLHAFTDYEAQLAAETRAAVERFCTPENLQAVIDDAVRATITAAVRDEVDAYYRRGDGRDAVRRAVEDALHRYDAP